MNNDNNVDKEAINPTLSPTSPAKIADNSGDNKLPTPDQADQTEQMNHVISDGGGYIELLEERPVVSKERLDVGKVTVTKHTRTKTIEVPIELVEEYITITTDYHDAESQELLSGNYDDKDVLRHIEPTLDSHAVVTVNDKQLAIGEAPIEIVISRQIATISKETYAIQEVAINKSIHTHIDNIKVDLQHEELDVKEEGFLAHENASNSRK